MLRIRELHEPDRPINRIAQQGRQALSDAELIAILIRSGTPGENAIDLAQRLLAEHVGLVGLLNTEIEQLVKTHGIGPTKAAALHAALELGRRLLLASYGTNFQIKSPSDVAQLMQLEMSNLDQEHLRVIAIDTKNRVQKIHTVYIGNLNSAIIRIGEVFKEPLKINACAIIIVHNHPSGDVSISPEDILVTKEIVSAGKLLDINVLDHLIIGKGQFASLRERGLGFE